MSHKCYDITFKLIAVAAAEGNCKEAAAHECEEDVNVEKSKSGALKGRN